MMEESTRSEVVCIFYESRDTLVSAFEQYLIRYEATHTLPERAESLHVLQDGVSSIPATLPISYQFRVI